MKVIVVNTQAPFIYGGAEILAKNLRNAFRTSGHEVEQVNIPFRWYPPEKIPDHILACRLLDVTEACGEKVNLVVALKFPAYFIKHPNKVMWLLHQHKTAYELWDTEYSDMRYHPYGRTVREIIIKSDNEFLSEAKKIYTLSEVVTKRLRKFNNIDSTPLYHPPEDYDVLRCDGYGDYIFFPSRMNPAKRQHLAVEAMRFTKTPVKLCLAGRSDFQAYDDRLNNLISKHSLNNRIKLLGEVSQEDKIKLFAGSLGILFIPYNEDYGYVTLEGMYSKKAVITTDDSGGPLEFIEDGVSGFICKPAAKAIAERMDELYLSKQKAMKMGSNSYEKILSMNLSWENVISALISHLS